MPNFPEIRPQGQFQIGSIAPGVSPERAASLSLGGRISQLGERISSVASELRTKQNRLARAQEVHNLTIESKSQLSQLAKGIEIPNPADAEDSFDEQSKTMRKQLESRIQDEQSRIATLQEFDKVSLSQRLNVTRDATRRQVSAYQAQSIGTKDALTKEYIEALQNGNQVEIQNIESRAESFFGEGVTAGIIQEDQAVKDVNSIIEQGQVGFVDNMITPETPEFVLRRLGTNLDNNQFLPDIPERTRATFKRQVASEIRRRDAEKKALAKEERQLTLDAVAEASAEDPFKTLRRIQSGEFDSAFKGDDKQKALDNAVKGVEGFQARKSRLETAQVVSKFEGLRQSAIDGTATLDDLKPIPNTGDAGRLKRSLRKFITQRDIISRKQSLDQESAIFAEYNEFLAALKDNSSKVQFEQLLKFQTKATEALADGVISEDDYDNIMRKLNQPLFEKSAEAGGVGFVDILGFNFRAGKTETAFERVQDVLERRGLKEDRELTIRTFRNTMDFVDQVFEEEEAGGKKRNKREFIRDVTQVIQRSIMPNTTRQQLVKRFGKADFEIDEIVEIDGRSFKVDGISQFGVPTVTPLSAK